MTNTLFTCWFKVLLIFTLICREKSKLHAVVAGLEISIA